MKDVNVLCVKFLKCIIMQEEISTKHSVSHLQPSPEDEFWLWHYLFEERFPRQLLVKTPLKFFLSHIQWQSYSPALLMQLVQTSINLENLLILLAVCSL